MCNLINIGISGDFDTTKEDQHNDSDLAEVYCN